MKKTVKLFIVLLIVTLVYFGYSSWIDNAAIYALSGQSEDGTKIFISMSNSSWINKWNDVLGGELITNTSSIEEIKKIVASKGFYVTGYMAPNSLLYSLLSSFKFTLVGGIIALFIPLIKKLFLVTILGILNYIKNREKFIIYSYKKTIKTLDKLYQYAQENNYSEVKKIYKDIQKLEFKPTFVLNLAADIHHSLIKFKDLSEHTKGIKIIKESVEIMYEKEKQRIKTGHPDEIFFDIKRGYEYSSKNSTFFINYYKEISEWSTSNTIIGFKIFSIEISKYIYYFLISMIPSIFISAFIYGMSETLLNIQNDKAATLLSIAAFLLTSMLFADIAQIFVIFRKKDYIHIKKYLLLPALVFYLLILIMLITISIGFVGLSGVGNITSPDSVSKTEEWFSELAYTILSSCIIFYMIATIVDAYRVNVEIQMKNKINGIYVSSFIWAVTVILKLITLFREQENINNILNTASTLILIIFWVYIFAYEFLINNLITNKFINKFK